MQAEEFFEIAEHHFDDALPFVLYRKPKDKTVKGLFQNNDTVFTTRELTESGFAFSPFNNEEDTILIPLESSHKFETRYTVNTEENEISSETDIASPEAKSFHIKLVSKAIKAIENDDFKKVVVSRKETVTLSEANPIKLFKRLLNTYQNAFVYCWYHPKIGLWLGATPETLVSTTGSRFTTMALAGTQAFKEGKEVVWQDKETNEQQLVTDFVVSSLQSSVSNINVSNVETVKAGTLLHLRTKITGVVASNLKSILKALHPTPAVCGLPKATAKQFILDNENYKREFYTGFLGELNIKEKTTRNTNRRNVENSAYASVKTVCNLFVNLRCMQLTNVRAHIYVGGGITKASNPEKEWEETVNKAQTMKKVMF